MTREKVAARALADLRRCPTDLLLAASEAALYRYYGPAGELLYIGASVEAIRRILGHRDAPWFNLIATITIERFETRDMAFEAERLAIIAEQPMHNKIRYHRTLDDGRRSEPKPRHLIAVQLEPGLAARVFAAAEADGRSVSSWMRKALIDRLGAAGEGG